MSGETPLTIIGNLTADPELRFTPQGQAVANFTIASTPRKYDRQAGEWSDGEALFMRCSVWRQTAENVAETLQKGMRVVATGRLKQRTYETNDGQRRTVVELEVDEIGPALRNASARVSKINRDEPGGSFRPQTASDPWATQPSRGGHDEPPF